MVSQSERAGIGNPTTTFGRLPHAYARLSREQRGLLTRPALEEVYAYRSYVDEELKQLFENELHHDLNIRKLLELGIAHEQQHQELLLTDILALFAAQPLQPTYATRPSDVVRFQTHTDARVSSMTAFAGGVFKTGHASEDGFAFDNESPVHNALIQPFRIASHVHRTRTY